MKRSEDGHRDQNHYLDQQQYDSLRPAAILLSRISSVPSPTTENEGTDLGESNKRSSNKNAPQQREIKPFPRLPERIAQRYHIRRGPFSDPVLRFVEFRRATEF